MLTRLERRRQPELMDRPDAEPAELARSLADLRMANRLFGGATSLLRLLRPLVANVDSRPVRILDVATGSADLPLAIARWASRRETAVEVVATDIHRGTLAVAHRRASPSGVLVAGADALRLPFRDGAFHVAVCSTALHHFDEDDAVTVLREMARVAAAGIVVLDLRRSRVALAAVGLLAATAWRTHPITRHDGPVSVRAAFTPRELRRLAERAGLSGAVVRRQPWFRQALEYRRPGGAG